MEENENLWESFFKKSAMYTAWRLSDGGRSTRLCRSDVDCGNISFSIFMVCRERIVVNDGFLHLRHREKYRFNLSEALQEEEVSSGKKEANGFKGR